MKGKIGLFGLLIATVMVAAVVASAKTSSQATPTAAVRATAVDCKGTIKLAIMTPLTGGSAVIGQEQLTWAKYAVKTLSKQLGLKIQLVTGDTVAERSGSDAPALAQKFIADNKVLGIIGPATSGAVATSSSIFFAAGMAHVSPSATRTSFTKGDKKEATPAFFRVVPGDYIQGPSDAKFMIEKLKVKKVVVIDFQEPYSQGLADAVEATLKKGNVSVSRQSISNTVTDYSSIVTKVPNDADIVFFPTQKPPDAQTFAQQLLEQGKRAKVFGGDGSNNQDTFKAAGSYVSNFAPDISGIKADEAIIAGWKKDNPKATLGSFGPPAYGAAQVLMTAIKRACTAGKGSIPNRRAVLRQIKQVRVKNWILGGSFRFSTKSNDPLNVKFYIFQIQSNGKYKLVG